MGAGSPADPRRALLADFRRNLERERRLSVRTSENYQRDILALFELTSGTPLERVPPQGIRRAVAQLHARGLSGKSLARMLSAWRGFYGWLVRHRSFAANPCAGVRAPKSAKQLPSALSPDAASRLLELAPEGALEARDRAMFELLYSSGLRLAELVSLDLGAARQMGAEAEVTVTGKGGKTRSVPVGAKALDALRTWLALRPPLAQPEEQALFISARGRRISHRMVQVRPDFFRKPSETRPLAY
ncbi:MAG: tyrosine-type recombinase/integrase, partial [Betaproteobacteria bacterium]|nr:tyrosine-type recombinase/integrase [Betaproteobacteria bacterium]